MTSQGDKFPLERVKGIEPSLSAWEADVLPLNYTRVRATVYLVRRDRARGLWQGDNEGVDAFVAVTDQRRLPGHDR
jgi:hypothetical protein